MESSRKALKSGDRVKHRIYGVPGEVIGQDPTRPEFYSVLWDIPGQNGFYYIGNLIPIDTPKSDEPSDW